jgi:hypothetical protein
MSDDRHETLSHSVESARPDVEIQRDDERLDDDFDVATAREQEHDAKGATRQADPEVAPGDVDPSVVDGS